MEEIQARFRQLERRHWWLWSAAIVVMLLTAKVPRLITLGPGLFVIMAVGVLTIGGCISRLRNRTAERQ